MSDVRTYHSDHLQSLADQGVSGEAAEQGRELKLRQAAYYRMEIVDGPPVTIRMLASAICTDGGWVNSDIILK